MLPPATGFNDLLEGELTSSGGANEASAAQADLQREIEKLNPFPLPHRGLLNGVLRAGSSRLLQLLAATAVGSMFGFSGASEMKDSTTTTAIYGAFGGATVGAMIGMLLLASDWVKARRAAGRHAPWLLELYVGRGFLSIVMWFVTAFLGAFAFIAWLAANTPGANPW